MSKGVVSLVFAGCALVIIGCGGSGGGGGTATGGSATTEVTQGTNAVNAMLANTSTVNSTNLAAAEQSFAAANATDPTNKNGNAGYALTLVALDTQKILDLFGQGSLATLDISTQTVLAKRLAAARFGVIGDLTPQLAVTDMMPVDLKGNITIVQIPALSTASRAYPTSPTYAQIVALLQLVQTDLGKVDTVLSNETYLPSDSAPLVLIDPPMGQVKIGTVEVRTLRSAVEALESTIDVLLTYNLGFNPSTYPYNTPFSTAFATAIATGNVPPSVYLPPSPFGTLNTGGAATLASGETFFKNAIASANAAITAYNARTGTGWVVNPGTVSATTITSYQANLNIATSALSGNYNIVAADGTTVTMQLGPWLNNPPASIAALMPTLQDSGGNVSITASDFPDLTFDHLFTAPLTSTQFGLNQGTWSDSGNIVTVLAQIGATTQ